MGAKAVLAAAFFIASIVGNGTMVERTPPLLLTSTRVDALEETFWRIGYDLESVRAESQAVPRVMLTSLPEDFDEIGSIERRKAVFIGIMLPAILHANEEVREERRIVERVRAGLAKGKTPSGEARARVETIAERYGVAADETDELLSRIDTVPVSLALAQAAIESGWGTSRFARQGKALFGQRTYGGAGLAPNGIARANFRVRTFDQPADSVAAYVYTLNAHPAYARFRELRAEMRRHGAPLDSHALAETLTRYSERGRDYVADVRAVMRANRMESLDNAQLEKEPRQFPKVRPPVGLAAGSWSSI